MHNLTQLDPCGFGQVNFYTYGRLGWVGNITLFFYFQELVLMTLKF